MGTRASITFVDNGVDLVKLYNCFDGYIEGLGYEIAGWLMKKKIGNGIYDYNSKTYANGVGCLAAQFIRDFKTEVGGLYVISLNSVNSDMVYNYRIEIDDTSYGTKKVNDITKIIITNWDNQKPIFVGSPEELLQFKETEDEEINCDDCKYYDKDDDMCSYVSCDDLDCHEHLPCEE